jgi:outer membrane protein
MNRYATIAFVIGALALATPFTTAAQDRIATVDLRKVFEDYWKTKQANAALKERGAELEKELKSMATDFEAGKEEYRKLLESANDQAVSSGERDKRKKAAEDKLKDLTDKERSIRQFEAQARETVEQQQKRMRDNILDEVKAAITSKAKAGSFTFVVDTAAETPNRTPVFLYNNSPNDLTDSVLGQLNATAPLDLGTSDTTGSDKKK